MGGASPAWLLLLATCYWHRVDSFLNTAITATSNTPLITKNIPPSISAQSTAPSFVSSKSAEPPSLSPTSSILPPSFLSRIRHSFPSSSSTTPIASATSSSSSSPSAPSSSPFISPSFTSSSTTSFGSSTTTSRLSTTTSSPPGTSSSGSFTTSPSPSTTSFSPSSTSFSGSSITSPSPSSTTSTPSSTYSSGSSTTSSNPSTTVSSSPSATSSSPSTTSSSSPSTATSSSPSATSSSPSITTSSSPSTTTSSPSNTTSSSPSATSSSPSTTTSSSPSTTSSSPSNTTSSPFNITSSPSSTPSSGSPTTSSSLFNSTSSPFTTFSSSSSTTSSNQSTTQTSHGNTSVIVLVCILVFAVLITAGAGAYIFYIHRYKPVRRVESIELPLVVPLPPDVSVERRILLSELSATVKNLFAEGHIGMSREYAELKSLCMPKPSRNATLTINRRKNRYYNILPYDETRVVLKEYPHIPGSDFINASYINGHSLAREFIACQGPLDTTVNDFWRMVWEKNVHVIVMVTQCVEGNKRKCTKYWPNIGQSNSFLDGTIKVKNLQEQEHHRDGFVCRKLQLHKRRSLRLVHHFHFISWPDMSCPAVPDQLISFVKSVKTATPNESSHTVVHCSAGVGRTGTFIALNNLMEEIHEQSSVDVFHAVYRMRLNRTNMVQTEAQYAFLYKCVLKYYLDQTGQSDCWPTIKRRLEKREDIPDVITGALKQSVEGDSTEQDVILIDEEEEEEEIVRV